MTPNTTSSRRYRFINTDSALLDSLNNLTGSVAVDTEFHSEHRYEPTLMMIQLADSTGDVLLIDALNIDDLKPVGAALAGRTLITHSGHHDIPLLIAHTGLQPHRVVDVQVLAGFCGFGYPKRLDELERRVLNITPTKSETLSDWSRRPLRADQLKYAAADVANLHRLHQALSDKNPNAKLAQSCTDALAAKALLDVKPEEAWRKIIGARVLNPRERGILKTLCEWREITAQERNQKVHQIASPSVVLDLARRRPKSIGALRGNRIFPRGVANRFGDDLLVQIAKGEKIPDSELPESVARSPLEDWIAASLQVLGHKIEIETGLAATLTLPAEIVSALVKDYSAGSTDSINDSWRAPLLVDSVNEIFEVAKLLQVSSE
jgi:ribonuclease D